MHDSFGMHFFQSLQQSSNHVLNFFRLEFIFFLNITRSYFYLIVKRSTVYQLKNEVKWVLRFVDLMELHCVLVIQLSHDLDFLDQALLSVLFAVCGLFRKGFDRIVLMIFVFFNQVHRSKVSLSNLLDWFELFMKAFLVEVVFQNLLPLCMISLNELQN